MSIHSGTVKLQPNVQYRVVPGVSDPGEAAKHTPSHSTFKGKRMKGDVQPVGISVSGALETKQAEVLRRAVEVIGSQDSAMRWMGTPVRALNYATPISLLHDESGFEAVRAVLGRLEHGVL